MKYNSIMIDLETMSTDRNAMVASIGAYKFDTNVVQSVNIIMPEQKFYKAVDLKSCERYGLKLDARTVIWWLEQDEEPRKALKGGEDLKEVLNEFRKFIQDGSGTKYLLWGNGATFDNIIIRNAFQAADVYFPIRYKDDMCYRTMRRMFNAKYEHIGVKHNALDDAISQGLILQQIFAKLGGKI